jgi:hypothetical protein
MDKKEKMYITKDRFGIIVIWKNVPKYDGECWSGDECDLGAEIYDDGIFDNLVEVGQCAEIDLSVKVKKVVFDYNESPEGRLMNAIFGKQ